MAHKTGMFWCMVQTARLHLHSHILSHLAIAAVHFMIKIGSLLVVFRSFFPVQNA